MKFNYFLIVLIPYFFINCSDRKLQKINLSELTNYPIIQRQTEITLLKSFIINEDCNNHTNEKFSDVFLAKVKNTNDTILIFSICKKTYPFLRNDFKGPRWLVIDSETVANQIPSTVISIIDKSFINKKYKIVVSDINNLED